jgi:Fe-S cluster biogenesis protein NfuA
MNFGRELPGNSVDGEEEAVAREIRSEVDRRNGALRRFFVDRTLYIGSASFASKVEAQGTPLVEKLFEIEGITEISLIGKMLVATRSDDRDWSDLIPQVEAVLSAYLVSGLALTSDEVFERMQLMGRGPREKIQYLLDHRINPGVAAHAGFVELLDVKEGVVYLRMGGGCQGCGAATFTLREGIEKIILKEVPEVRQILDVTDHAAGMNPYYRPAK